MRYTWSEHAIPPEAILSAENSFIEQVYNTCYISCVYREPPVIPSVLGEEPESMTTGYSGCLGMCMAFYNFLSFLTNLSLFYWISVFLCRNLFSITWLTVHVYFQLHFLFLKLPDLTRFLSEALPRLPVFISLKKSIGSTTNLENMEIGELGKKISDFLMQFDMHRMT